MALRVALGLPKWTPNVVLMKIAGQEVLSEKIKRLVAQFFMRQLANGVHSPIYDQNCKPSIKLIKRDEVMIANLFTDLDTSTDHIIAFPDTLILRNNFCEIFLSDFSFQNKAHPAFLIKDLFEEVVYKEFQDYHIIATDASKSHSFTSIAGISNLQSFVYRIHPINSIFTAEALAICQALDELSVTDKNLLLLTDSYSVLQALKCLTIKSPKETINVPSINAALLKNLHKELYKNENKDASAYWKPRYLSYDGVSRIDFKKQKIYKRKKKDRKVEETESEEDEDNENFSDIDMEEEKELNNEEIMWLHNVLMSQFHEAEDLVKMPSYITKINLNSRHSAECIIYERYLQQKLMCTDIPIDEEDFIFSGNNYNLTLADVAHHFVQPPVSEDSTMVLAPNWATLNGMDIIQATEKRLHRTGRFIHHSVPYIRYLTGRSSAYPKCINCCRDKNPGACAEKFNINQMKANLIIPNEDMRIATMVENAHPSVQEQKCCCEELAESKAAADLLAKRFMSLFLWPTLLSSVNLSTEQEELIVRKKQSRRGRKKRPSLQSDDSIPNNKKRRLNSSRKSPNIMVKKDPGESSTVSTKVKRKRQYGTNSHRSQRKVILKQENGSESNSTRVPVITSVQSLESPLRRSRRSAVLQRRSFAFIDKCDEESS
ncbi:hypothetical protein AVEN_118630-1 [Araneus ventricosus]|uniref:RNase H type-1 domain-containing protein n=1 Tax=Araneus ventricosus TaxID=182803 RepID=A0A4Y2AYS4_ARAVE|nr:hypothetical protein AVEN_118630-1 [Araneus ventricosus]